MDTAIPVIGMGLWSVTVRSIAVVAVAATITRLFGRRCVRTRRAAWSAAVLVMAGLLAVEVSRVLRILLDERAVPGTFVLPDGMVLSITDAAPLPPAWWQQVIVVAWFAGLAYLVLASARRSLVRHRVVGRAGPSVHQAEVASLSARLRVRPPRALVTDQIVTAALSGVWRPVLLLGRGSGTWTAERRRQVMLHELAHAQAGDPVFGMIGRVVRTALWPNPLVWIATSQLRAAQELASDAAVLAAGEEAASYATTLLDLACDVRTRRLAMLGLSSPTVARRVEAILDQRDDRGRARERVAAARVALLASGLLIAMAPMPDGRGQAGPVVHDLRQSVGGNARNIVVDRDDRGRVRVRAAGVSR